MHLPAFFRVLTFWTILDLALCALILRLVAGWLLGNPRLAKLLVILLCLAGFFAVVQRNNVPVTRLLTDALVLPAAFLAVFNFLPDLRRAYQAATLRQIFAHPVNGSVRWSDIESLFVALGGEVTEREGSRVGVFLFGQVRVFHRPHPSPDTDKGAVTSVRKWLESNGVRP